jgi:hypothetical protein
MKTPQNTRTTRQNRRLPARTDEFDNVTHSQLGSRSPLWALSLDDQYLHTEFVIACQFKIYFMAAS